MKHAPLAVLIAFAPCPAILSQSAKSPARRPSRTEAELKQLERDIGAANIRRDKPFFQRVEADEFVFTDSAGGLTTKEEDLAGLDQPAGEMKLLSYVVDEMRVLDYGRTAVVLGRVTTTSRKQDRETVNRTRFTEVL
jgi:hypothetical protein